MLDPRGLWQQQDISASKMTPQEVRRASAILERQAKWREWRVYLASLVWMPLMGIMILTNTDSWVRWGLALILYGGLVAIWEQAWHSPTHSRVEGLDFLDAWRSQLEREREKLRSMRRWQLVPYLPGVVLVAVGAARQGAQASWFVMNVGGLLLLYFWLRWLKARAIRWVDDQLDALGDGARLERD